MDLSPDWIDFIDCLLSNEVEFIVVGAFALAFHELPRMTGDIDFWVRPTEDNSRRIHSALHEFGLSSINLAPLAFAGPDKILVLGVPPNRIDVMTSIDGVSFAEAWIVREKGLLAGRELGFLSRELLLKNKLATGRTKDRADAELLMKKRKT